MSSHPTRATVDGRAYLDLQRMARTSGRDTQELFYQYALHGFLARLARSGHASKFVLKGGVLLAAYGTRRATRDVDLQVRQLVNDVDHILGIVRDVASMSGNDGLVFDYDAATARTIRDDETHQGVRVELTARLATARIGFHVDVNIGDPIWPAPRKITLPGLLGDDVEILGYPLAMVHAEKIVTAVHRQESNTRWRDFLDIYSLSGRHTIEGDELRSSVEQVSAYREVPLEPLGRTLHGWADSVQPRWATWRRKQRLTDSVPERFSEVLAAVIEFADPVLDGEAAGATWDPAHRAWLN